MIVIDPKKRVNLETVTSSSQILLIGVLKEILDSNLTEEPEDSDEEIKEQIRFDPSNHILSKIIPTVNVRIEEINNSGNQD